MLCVATNVSRALLREIGLYPEIIPSFHHFDKISADTARVTYAPPIPAETTAVGENCDFGSVTVLFVKLGGLQILEPSNRDW